MASPKKRKVDDVIFELSEGDISPEHESENEARNEPQTKIMKFLESELSCESINLEIERQSQNSTKQDDSNVTSSTSLEEIEDVIVITQSDITETKTVSPEKINLNGSPTVQSEVRDVKFVSTDSKNKTENSTNKAEVNGTISITFSDKLLAELYKPRFKHFIESVALEIIEDKEKCLKIRCGKDKHLSEFKKKKKKKKSDKNLYFIDAEPFDKKKLSERILFSTKYTLSEKNQLENEPNKGRSGQRCFNCSGNHSLIECPLPRDHNRINDARQQFQLQKQTIRYHSSLSAEDKNQKSSFLPGKISDQLREALGLKKNQLPRHIYKMRMYGYPPGWWEEIMVEPSSLEVFDSDGQVMRTEKKMMDWKKLIGYSGFNEPMEEGVEDEYKFHDAPPFCEKQNKKYVIEYFEKQFSNNVEKKVIANNKLEAITTPRKENVQEIIKNRRLKDIKERESDTPSPSLLDLEKQKETLLAALEENANSNLTLDGTISVEGEDTEENSTMNSDSNEISENSLLGTPILASISPYSKLPDLDNFSKGVSPVINFENLPNSTGTYDKMKEVLEKVRNHMKVLQNQSLP